jgi:hypothetical protein
MTDLQKFNLVGGVMTGCDWTRQRLGSGRRVTHFHYRGGLWR